MHASGRPPDIVARAGSASTAVGRGRSTPWRMIAGVVAVVVGGMCVLLVLGWRASDRLLRPSVSIGAQTLSDYPGLHPRMLTLQSQTGIRLAGRFFPGRSHATIILSHGYGDTQNRMLPWVSFLHRAGFSIFTYDLRGSGGSGGEATIGVLEQKDLVSVVDYLVSRPDVDRHRIGALGFSIGGAITILAAAQDPRIGAVVDDSALADARHWLRLSVLSGLRHPDDPLSFLSVEIARARLGLDITAVRPMDRIASISPRPVLIIQGTADTVVPPGEGLLNFNAAKQPKELWMVHGAAHGEALQREGIAYTRRVVEFFKRALHTDTTVQG